MEDVWKGYCIDLIEKLSIEMNFKYELVVKDKFGSLDPVTNKWNGLIGGLVDGVSRIYSSRYVVIDFRTFIYCCVVTGTRYCDSCTHHDIGTGRSYRFYCPVL